MKILRLILILTLITLTYQCSAQVIDAKEVERLKKMAEGLKNIDKATMMKNRDSIMKSIQAITQAKDSLAAKTLDANAPKTKAENKTLLNDIIKRRYDTTFTIVDFQYRVKRKEPYTTVETYLSGSTENAVVIKSSTSQYIHVESKSPMVEAALNQQLKLKVISEKYKTAYQSLEVNGGYSKRFQLGEHTVREKGNSISDTVPAAFTFNIDELQKIATSAAGAGINVTGVERIFLSDTARNYNVTRESGAGAATDLAKVKMSGVTNLKTDSTKPILTVTKTASGYRLSYTFTHTDGDGTPENSTLITESFTAYIGEHMPQYEAVITPVERKDYQYKKWIPSGPKVNGTDDTRGNKDSRFKIVVRDKADTTKKYPGQFTVEWALDHVTHYKGICNNYPPQQNDPNTNNDLHFDEALKTNPAFESAQTNDDEAVSKQNAGNDAIVTIESMDYAAWGQLLATVTLDDGSRELSAVAYYNTKVAHLTVPYDSDENKIADAWEDSLHIGKKGYALTWDNDNQPSGQRESGDGYTLLEEYRGFAVTDAPESGNTDQYKHQRTDPLKKDGFVYDPDQLFAKYYDPDKGNGGTNNPANIRWHYLSATKNQLQYDENALDDELNRWVNFNSGEDVAIAPQYAIAISFAKFKYNYDSLMTAVSFTKAEWQISRLFVKNPNLKPEDVPGPLGAAYMAETSGDVQYTNPMKKHIKIEIIKEKIEDKCAFIKTESGAAAFMKAVDILIGNAVRHEVGHCLGIPHHKPNAVSGTESCVMRYETHDQRKNAAFIATIRKHYCNNGESGPLYTIMDPGQPNEYEVPAVGTTIDDCYKKITIKTTKE